MVESRESDGFPTPEIPADIYAAFEKEVELEVGPMAEFMPAETVDYYEVVGMETRTATYQLLKWLYGEHDIELSLQPGAGFEKVPALTLGTDKVVQTSLEKYDPEEAKQYYGEEEEAMRVVADNERLPFSQDSFDALLVLETTFAIAGQQRDELLRTLKPGGVVVITESAATYDDDKKHHRVIHYRNSGLLEEIPVPKELQDNLFSGVRFTVFRKK